MKKNIRNEMIGITFFDSLSSYAADWGQGLLSCPEVVYIASAFPLAHHYRAVLAWGP